MNTLLLIIIVLLLLIGLFKKYRPRIDIIKSNNKLSIYLWFNMYDNKRKYIKLL